MWVQISPHHAGHHSEIYCVVHNGALSRWTCALANFLILDLVQCDALVITMNFIKQGPDLPNKVILYIKTKATGNSGRHGAYQPVETQLSYEDHEFLIDQHMQECMQYLQARNARHTIQNSRELTKQGD
ncbi:hypothetical protein HAX54_038876 [Datura stramonium]|uniref:Uncharacterized protein n=1 Tax=Datura stramonium TaxID=4076 RepID=A0ABS8SJI1_DATST|nr:hypothetical protein [Datura stramonium]